MKTVKRFVMEPALWKWEIGKRAAGRRRLIPLVKGSFGVLCRRTRRRFLGVHGRRIRRNRGGLTG